MNRCVVMLFMILVTYPAFAQERAPLAFGDAVQEAGRSESRDTSVATPTGQDLSVSVGGYNYAEPGVDISIHGLKVGGDYTAATSLTPRVFVRANVRGSGGAGAYDGWCRPYLIRPNSASANGYELGFGERYPCSDTGEPDWYLESRGEIGRDFTAGRWGLSPATGLGVRYLSNGTGGVAGFRTDTYLYLPLAFTARTAVRTERVLSLTVELDTLLRGWQTTHESKLGGGGVPATPDAPAFTIVGLTDLSFSQRVGGALRAAAFYPLTRRWSAGTSYIYWNVGASDPRSTTATFIVNGITAQQEMQFYEPDNVTHEWMVTLRWHF